MPNLGNPTNPDGTTSKSQTGTPVSQPGRPGAVTRGPGKNKPKMHLVASGNKIPAEIIVHALAKVQAGNSSGTGPQKLANHTPLHGADPKIHEAQHSQPPGVVTTNPGHTKHTKQPAKDFLKKPVGTLNTNLHGAKKAAMQTIDKRSSLQKRKDRSARLA